MLHNGFENDYNIISFVPYKMIKWLSLLIFNVPLQFGIHRVDNAGDQLYKYHLGSVWLVAKCYTDYHKDIQIWHCSF